jgi:hypothetical protein
VRPRSPDDYWRCGQPGSADVGVVVIDGDAFGVAGSVGGSVIVLVSAVVASVTGTSVSTDSDVGKGTTGVDGSDTTAVLFSTFRAIPSALMATTALPPITVARSFTRGGLFVLEFTSDHSVPVFGL